MARGSSSNNNDNGASDRDMERVLREHFEAESSDLRMSKDPWDWLEGRMEEPDAPPPKGIWDAITRIFQPRPVLVAAGTLAAMMVFAVIVWNVVDFGGMDDEADPQTAFSPAPSPAPATPAPAATMAPAPAPTAAPATAPPIPAPTAAPTMAPLPAPTMIPTPTRQRFIPEVAATPAIAMSPPIAGPTAAPTLAPGPEPTLAPAATAAPTAAPTPAPAATAAPTMAPTPTARPVSTPERGGIPPAATFQDYQRERFVSAAVDNVSTFSLDTDRTSYFLALNWARNGYQVEPDSVRAEEWINAFDYGYNQPRRDDSFAIYTDIVRHPLDDRMHLARIVFQAPDLNYDATPVNVTLVLDASGSMAQGNRVDIAREAAESIRLSLREQDRIAVVHFSTDVIDAYTVAHTHADDRNVWDSINNLRPTGSTNVQAGLNDGVWLADQARRRYPDAYNYIILMSDGVANVDATDPFAILESAGNYDDANPLRLITIGVGIENFNDFLLEQLAQHGNGWYRYLTDVNQARATFSRENWLALSTPFADQTRAQVTWDPDVVNSWRIVGYENRVTSDESFTQARREFAEIPAGAATTVFYELELSDPRFSGPLTLGDVELRWVTPSTLESNRQHAMVMGQDDTDFRRSDTMLRLGAVLALFSDRYSSLPWADVATPSVVDNLLHLQMRELETLEPDLGHLGAFQDLAFLLEHITQNSLDVVRTPSGYSR